MAIHANSIPAAARRPLLPSVDGATLLSTAQLLDLLGGRAQVENTLDRLIALLDTLDGDVDLEETADAEPSLGWIDGKPQLSDGSHEDREADTADDEPTLGAPERSPWVTSMTCPYHEPADGSRPYRTRDGRQTHWSAGRNGDGANDGESEPGYDLPEGDDERDAAGDVDDEPVLAAPENHDEAPNQERWAQGSDSGDRERDDDDCPAYLSMQQLAVNEAAARDALRQVGAIWRRKDGRPAVGRDPDELELGNLRLLTLAG